MERLPRSMARKRQRYFNESKTLASLALIIFGACFLISLYIVYPQMYSSQIFNSRLIYHMTLDVNHYYTCDKDYESFVYNEPNPVDAMYQLYVFNVTNTYDVIQKGSKPLVQEIGPFGFRKNVYKYDINFVDTDNSPDVDFKEFNVLEEVDDPIRCENMYYALEKDYGESDPCSGGSCKCKDLDQPVTVINPLFQKVLEEDTTKDLLAYYAVDVFTEIKRLLDGPFVEAVLAQMVHKAYKEIFLFRAYMQSGVVLKDAYASLLNQGLSAADIATSATSSVASCDLLQYGESSCTFKPYEYITQALLAEYSDIASTDYPSLHALLDEANEISFMNAEYGLHRWVGLAWLYDHIEFSSNGFTMVSKGDMQAVADDFVYRLADLAFGDGTGVMVFTEEQTLGCNRTIQYAARFVGLQFVFPFYLDGNLQTLAYQEFNSTYEPVVCAPLGEKCMWQWGYQRQYRQAYYGITMEMINSMVDLATEVRTNYNNFYKDTNGAPWYNSYLYCNNVFNAPSEFDLQCTNYEGTFEDGLYTRPGGLWGRDKNIVGVDVNEAINQFRLQTSDIQEQYFHFACNVSDLQQKSYRTATNFHDLFTVKYLNKNKDPLFSHDFTIENFKADLGMAQWGGGFVTHATDQVRTTNQINRDGMWNIGRADYTSELLEFSSWSVIQGFPQAWIYNVADSRALLEGLTRRDQAGLDFRRHITYIGTTFFGDGTNFVNDVGDAGDVAYTFEAATGNFSCPDMPHSAYLCELLNVPLASSAAICRQVQDLFETCYTRYTFAGDNWIDVTQCTNFETSMTSPTQGIQCTELLVYGNPHPYIKKRGNVLMQMMFGLTQRLMMLDGLWCTQADGCQFNRGGLFTTTTVRKLLFDGFNEASLLKYFNLLYESKDIGFECANNPKSQCGLQNHHCDDAGLRLKMVVNGRTKLDQLLKYGTMPNEEFFAPHFEIEQSTGKLLWPFASNPTIAKEARAAREQGKDITIVRNPHFAAYPAWNTNDTDFLKYYQCQRRLYMGPSDLFSSCVDQLHTGRDDVRMALNMKAYHGNATMESLNHSFPLNGTGDESRQYPGSLWTGFQVYPYNYQGLEQGANHTEMKSPVMFNKQHSIFLELSQDSLNFDFQKEITVSVPFLAGPTGIPGTDTVYPPSLSLPTRRFVEDVNTWDKLKWLAKPVDEYGMPYKVPTGMASLQKYTGFPAFADTPHLYGNRDWNGKESTLISGNTPSKYKHRTFLDYDPVTGSSHRQALRQQVSLRVRSGPLLPVLFSSQQRCVVPIKSFAAYGGYGCFTFIPLLWYEDSNNVKPDRMNRLFDHFYLRPDRAAAIGYMGLAVGAFFLLIGIFLFISEAYHRHKFVNRVYVDP